MLPDVVAKFEHVRTSLVQFGVELLVTLVSVHPTAELQRYYVATIT